MRIGVTQWSIEWFIREQMWLQQVAGGRSKGRIIIHPGSLIHLNTSLIAAADLCDQQYLKS